MGWKDIFKKNVGKGVSSTYFPTFQKASPVIGKVADAAGSVAGGVGAAGTAAKGAVFGGAVAAGASLVNSIADPGFILFIVGLLTFIFNEYAGNVVVSVIIGSFFLFFSSIFIFKAKGIMFAAIFWVWYIAFGGITDPNALIYLLLPLVIIGMVVHGLTNKIRGGSFGEGASGEIIGLVPVLFFFLDLGLLDFLTKTFELSLSPFLQNLLLFTPWWALLGLFATKKESFAITVFRVAGIMYVFIILTVGVVPDAYAKYREQSLVPGPGQFLEAKKELKERLPQRENPALSHLACLFGGELTDLQGCIQKRQEQSEWKGICQEQEKNEPGTAEFDDCIKEQQEKKKQGIDVSGAQDPTRNQPMKAEFVESPYFPKSTFRSPAEEVVSYPLEFKVENPRKLEFDVKFSCSVKKGAETVPAVITGPPEGLLKILKEETTGTTVICQTSKLEGSYQLAYEARLKGVQTTSILRRAFIGNKDLPWKEEWLPRIMPAHFSGNQHRSQAAADLARLNFALGKPVENPIIEWNSNNEQGDGVVLSAAVENAGSGKILSINSYRLALDGFSGNNCPLESTKAITPPRDFTKSIYLFTCFVNELPLELKNPVDYVYREFTGTMNYDYQITREIPIEVKVIASEGAPEGN